MQEELANSRKHNIFQAHDSFSWTLVLDIMSDSYGKVHKTVLLGVKPRAEAGTKTFSKKGCGPREDAMSPHQNAPVPMLL